MLTSKSGLCVDCLDFMEGHHQELTLCTFGDNSPKPVRVTVLRLPKEVLVLTTLMYTKGDFWRTSLRRLVASTSSE